MGLLHECRARKLQSMSVSRLAWNRKRESDTALSRLILANKVRALFFFFCSWNACIEYSMKNTVP